MMKPNPMKNIASVRSRTSDALNDQLTINGRAAAVGLSLNNYIRMCCGLDTYNTTEHNAIHHPELRHDRNPNH